MEVLLISLPSEIFTNSPLFILGPPCHQGVKFHVSIVIISFNASGLSNMQGFDAHPNIRRQQISCPSQE